MSYSQNCKLENLGIWWRLKKLCILFSYVVQAGNKTLDNSQSLLKSNYSNSSALNLEYYGPNINAPTVDLHRVFLRLTFLPLVVWFSIAADFWGLFSKRNVGGKLLKH